MDHFKNTLILLHMNKLDLSGFIDSDINNIYSEPSILLNNSFILLPIIRFNSKEETSNMTYS